MAESTPALRKQLTELLDLPAEATREEIRQRVVDLQRASAAEEEVEDIARCASVDKRSVIRALAGLAVRGMAGERIALEFTRRGARPRTGGASMRAPR